MAFSRAAVSAVPAATVVTGEISALDVGAQENAVIRLARNRSREASPARFLCPAPVARFVSGQFTRFAITNWTPAFPLTVRAPIEPVPSAVPGADHFPVFAWWLANDNGLRLDSIAMQSNTEAGKGDNVGHYDPAAGHHDSASPA